MFKVHFLFLLKLWWFVVISKHFMFKVHSLMDKAISINRLFQNISCLRFMNEDDLAFVGTYEFQNISCLRFMQSLFHYFAYILLFQNISCLRFILNIAKSLTGIEEFQNISCLRFILMLSDLHYYLQLFQNISCLRFIWYFFIYKSRIPISKHFMFKVHTKFCWIKAIALLFQNISCLRFMIVSNFLC